MEELRRDKPRDDKKPGITDALRRDKPRDDKKPG